ncbi:MAG TPA: hypothetical protein EYP17_00875 [Candidatus Latescibacteria bacterium]|nr:hypothetical protein [Candidatus Latescibacterota bacterium]
MRWLCVVGALLWASQIWAEVPQMGVAVGTVTVEGKQWQRISLRPDIPIGPFGVALDIELFVDHEGNFSKRGWDFSTGQAARETIFRKIYYIRYGRPKDPVFMKVGALDNVTLGYGLIVDGYTNALEYPSVKRIGFQGDVKGRIHFQWVVNDIDDAFTGGPWFGVRAALPVFGKLRVGGTLAMDVNQYAGLKDRDGDDVPDAIDPFPDDGTAWMNTDADSDFPDMTPDYRVEDGDTVWVDTLDIDGDNIYDAFQSGYRKRKGREPFKKSENTDRIVVVGVDMGYPLLEGPVGLELYGQAAKFLTGESKGGWGLAAPGLKLTAGSLAARLEYRNFKGRFRPEYFNDLYDLERARVVGDSVVTKEADLDTISLQGVFGRAVLRVGDLVSVRATYQYLTGERRDQRFYVDGRALELLLRQVPRLEELSAYYHKDHIDTKEAGFFDPTPNTIYGYKIGFQVGQGVQLIWHAHYEYTPTEDPKKPKLHKYVTVETEVRF